MKIQNKSLGPVDICSIAPATPTFCGLSAESMDPADKPRDVGLETKCQQTLVVFLILLLFNVQSEARVYFDNNEFCHNLEPIKKYSCLTEHAVEGIRLLGKQIKQEELAVLKAIEAMNLVQNIASSGRYKYIKSRPNFTPPAMQDQSSMLNDAYGICGNHQYLFLEILKNIGLQSRSVDFYYTANGVRQTHAAAEVKIGSKWVYFDITWGSYWLENKDTPFKLMSIEEIRKGKGVQVTGSNSWYLSSVYLFRKYKMEGVFSYISSKDFQMLKNKGGIFSIQLKNKKVDFSNIPNYIGNGPESTSLKLKTIGNFPPSSAVLTISGVGGDCVDPRIQIGSKQYPLKVGAIEIQLSKNSIIELKSNSASCYGIISSLNLS